MTRPYDSTTFDIERLRLEVSMTLRPGTFAASEVAVLGALPPLEALELGAPGAFELGAPPEEPPESERPVDPQAALVTAAAMKSARMSQRDVCISTAFLA
jgi:hypothetical protein